jgi:hypothetical protein
MPMLVTRPRDAFNSNFILATKRLFSMRSAIRFSSAVLGELTCTTLNGDDTGVFDAVFKRLGVVTTVYEDRSDNYL